MLLFNVLCFVVVLAPLLSLCIRLLSASLKKARFRCLHESVEFALKYLFDIFSGHFHQLCRRPLAGIELGLHRQSDRRPQILKRQYGLGVAFIDCGGSRLLRCVLSEKGYQKA